ncbi:MAG: hypothetical protein JW966_05140 [Anaerolineae bacterium]|nr:hypothetical protein [Anaerolineae bacterium]
MTTINGYLVADEAHWRIPAYAQDMLWMQQNDHAARVSGPRGAFALDVPGEGHAAMVVAWGTAGGPPLTIWHRPDTQAPFVVGWQGTVGVGGFVERLHVFETRGLELVIAEVNGGLLPPDTRALPTLAQMQTAPFSRREQSEQPLAHDFTYTFIAMADSAHAEYLHHAMVSELAVDCWATLAPQAGDWHTLVGLPLLLNTITLLAGYPARYSSA